MKISQNIFLDKNSNKLDELNRLGFTIIKGIDQTILKKIKEETSTFIKEIKRRQPKKSQLYNLINSETEIRKKSNEIVSKYLTPWVENNIDLSVTDFYPVSHIIKPFGIKSDIWHQDAAIVDETRDYSLNVWMPLVDSTLLNGCIWIIPGSHIFDNYHRVFGDSPINKNILKGIKMQPVLMKKGDILLFHRNTIHGSSNNYLPWERIAVEGVLMNKNASFIKYFNTEVPNELKRYRVSKELFLNDNPKQYVQDNNCEYEIVVQKESKDIVTDFYNQLKCFELHSKQLPKSSN